MTRILFPDAEPRRLVFYLAAEDWAAARVHPGEELFFLWQSRPTVIFGRNQDMEAEVNVSWCRANGVEMYRRKSGGGCVYSDGGNLMLSYICGATDVAFTFDRYLQRLTLALRRLGLPAERSGHNDILVGGRKVSGNAYHRLPQASIVHGTLLYDSDFDALESAITPPREKLSRHGVQSVRQRVGNLRPMLEELAATRPELAPLTEPGPFKAWLLHFFCDGERRLTEEELSEIAAIENTYLDPAFIAGRFE